MSAEIRSIVTDMHRTRAGNTDSTSRTAMRNETGTEGNVINLGEAARDLAKKRYEKSLWVNSKGLSREAHRLGGESDRIIKKAEMILSLRRK